MYTLNTIENIADCDLLLTWANKEKAELTLKQMIENHSVSNYGNTSVEISAVLQGVIAEINAANIIIANLPEGAAKQDAVRKKTRLEYRKFVLETRQENYGTVALLEKQLDLQRLTRELDEVELFIAGVTAHKATLQ